MKFEEIKKPDLIKPVEPPNPKDKIRKEKPKKSFEELLEEANQQENKFEKSEK